MPQVRASEPGANAGECLSVFLRLHGLPRAAEAVARSLLRVLFLWFGSLSADAGGRDLLLCLRRDARNDRAENRQRVGRAVRFALFEILPALAHGVGYVREAENPRAPRARKRIERRGFHLDREHAPRARGLDRLRGFAKRRVRGPA